MHLSELHRDSALVQSLGRVQEVRARAWMSAKLLLHPPVHSETPLLVSQSNGSNSAFGLLKCSPPPRHVVAYQKMSSIVKEMKIFIQIASYRDKQLKPTIDDMLCKADHPEELNFGLCWQYGPEEDPNIYDKLPNFRVAKFHYSKSKGLCWARSITNSLYRGEELTLQIDSHHRFVRGWDTLMLEDYAMAKHFSSKPVLTTYLPPFDPDEELLPPRLPTLMSQYCFHAKSRLLGSKPLYLPDHKAYWNRVIPARTISCHFYLVEGKFIETVPYDANLYFGGEIEEVSMTLRAWTHGYDFFSPSRDTIAWHEYTRKNRPKHWNDHKDWSLLEHRSRKRFDIICGRTDGDEIDNPQAEGFGIGGNRTLEQYSDFAGIDFINCRIQNYTLAAKEPPNTLDDQTWSENFGLY